MMILDRTKAIEARQDPFGTIWGVRAANKELAFFCICKQDKEGQLVVPPTYPNADMEGKFTKPRLAFETIDAYLTTVWDMADEEAAKNVRKDKNNKIEDKRLKIEATQEAA